jgi:hypothetical protein
MKLFSIILSIHILFLTLVPSLPLSAKHEQCKKSCCSSTRKPVKNDGCCKDVCNPFMSCCNFHALTMNSEQLITPVIYLTQNFYSPIEIFNFYYVSESWHPPQSS